MSKTIISEGKTTNEAIEKGLKELNTTKNMVDIKVLENTEKRSFFDILAPRVVKVEISLKETVETVKKEVENKGDINPNKEDIEIAQKRVSNFLNDFLKNISEKLTFEVNVSNEKILVNINGEDAGFLIGYRGDVLNSIQTILAAISNRGLDSRVKILVDIANYKEKRAKSLEELAIKISKTVAKTGKSVTLEPMIPYERKVIHAKLQDNKYVKTCSIGEEPNRKVVISKK